MGDVKDLVRNEAAKKIKELAEGADICMFTTALSQLPLTSRPMSTRAVDDEGNIWFFSKDSSNKNTEITADKRVQLFYTSSKNSEYLSVYGEATILSDTDKAAELWSAWAKAWFPEGVDDPELTIIKVTPLDSYYWDTKNNQLVSLLKIAASALTGKEMDDGIEGKINI